jgi:hypothetical protein
VSNTNAKKRLSLIFILNIRSLCLLLLNKQFHIPTSLLFEFSNVKSNQNTLLYSFFYLSYLRERNILLHIWYTIKIESHDTSTSSRRFITMLIFLSSPLNKPNLGYHLLYYTLQLLSSIDREGGMNLFKLSFWDS